MRDAAVLARLFPHARLQPKGLLATEGVVTFPLAGYAGAALAIRSHFFEFIPFAEPPAMTGEPPLLANQLTPGQRYEVVLTTGGGLYRYRLHDTVEVVGYANQCPLLRFIGKTASISDRFGEKLNEYHVRQVFEHLFTRYGIQPGFAMLACEEGAARAAYTLFIESDAAPPLLRALCHDLDLALQENFHYRYCRKLGQLDHARIFAIDSEAHADYMAACQAQGQRAGDVKQVALHRLDGWARVFRGQYVG